MAQTLKLNTSYKNTAEPWDAKQTLAHALAERDQFLKSHPQHRAFQTEIDQMLDKAGNTEARMKVLAIMMESKLIELHGQLKSLNGILLKCADPIRTNPA